MSSTFTFADYMTYHKYESFEEFIDWYKKNKYKDIDTRNYTFVEIDFDFDFDYLLDANEYGTGRNRCDCDEKYKSIEKVVYFPADDRYFHYLELDNIDIDKVFDYPNGVSI